MDQKSLAAYLKNFSFVILLFKDPVEGANNYKGEISLLFEYAQKSTGAGNSICFLSKTERDCREFTSHFERNELEKVNTFSVNEILFLGPTPKYNIELSYPSDLLIIHFLEHYPKMELLKGRMKILLTTKSVTLFDTFCQMNPSFQRIVLYQNDVNLFNVNHLVNLTEQK